MKKVIIIGKCSFTHNGIYELLHHRQDVDVEIVELPTLASSANFTELFFQLEKINFSLLILEDIHATFNRVATMEFIHYFHHAFRGTRKLAVFSCSINLLLLACVYGVRPYVIDTKSTMDDLAEEFECILHDDAQGYVSLSAPSLLTPMQQETLALYLKGLSMVEAARQCGKSPKTMSAHKRLALRMLGVKRLPQLINLNIKYLPSRSRAKLLSQI